MTKNDDFLEKYNNIWYKVYADINQASLSKKTFLKTTIKPHGDEITDFYDKDIVKVDSNHTCSARKSLDCTLNKNDNYYLQFFLKEYKYIEEKVIRHIVDDLESSSNDSGEEQINPNLGDGRG